MTRPSRALALLAVAACGGRVEVGDGGAGPDTASSAVTKTGGTAFPECPPSEPQPGLECTSPGQGCRYYAASGCVTFVCGASQRWELRTNGC